MIGTCAAHIACNLMVTQQIGRIIIELPLPGKCRSILNSMRTSKAAMNNGSDITSPENIGGLWLGERLLTCHVTIIFDSLPVSFECEYSLDLVLYFLQGINPFRKLIVMI